MGVKMTRGKLKYLVAACVAACAVAAGLTTALAANSTQAPASAASSIVPQLGSAAKADFAVFSQPQAGNEDVAEVSEVLKPLDAQLDPASVRVAQTSGGLQAQVAGDSQSVCLVLRIPGKADAGGCAPEAHAATPATPIIGTTAYPPGEPARPGGQRALAVLFPNGVSGAQVTTAGGDHSALDLINNTVTFVADEGDTLDWIGPEGHAYSSTLIS
jgi:hypothetical protein